MSKKIDKEQIAREICKAAKLYKEHLVGRRFVYEEDGRVYLVDPLGVTGNFEYYCHVEEQRAYESVNKIWGIGVLYDRKRKARYL